jgi:galacturonokinase
MSIRILVVPLYSTFLFLRSIENKYLGLENGILDPSAVLLSRYGYLTFMDCKVIFASYAEFILFPYLI